jgi:NAD(P)H-hydrate repair Nnr-like enzyme with NAD(P)H-hydrate dehydratase domain
LPAPKIRVSIERYCLHRIISALIEAGIKIDEAAIIAAQANRLAGSYAEPNPATRIIEIIHHLPRALEEL